jgi:hypothetical protein
MRSRSFKAGRLWEWIMAFCLSVSPTLAQSQLSSSVQASSFRAVEDNYWSGDRRKTGSYGSLGVILLAISGLVGALPRARARCRLWCGDHQGAAQIYEKILRKHPERVKFYPPLANIYLHLGRDDAPAMKVYKAILRLNLAAPNRQEINMMVAQKYLTIDFTDESAIKDDDVIPVLEEALKTVYPIQSEKLQLKRRALPPVDSTARLILLGTRAQKGEV